MVCAVEMTDYAAYDPQTGVAVPFKSVANSLVARLRLEESLGISTINLLLSILHSPSFKIEELTIRDGSEIDDEVARYKRDVQLQRSSRRTHEFPYPVLEVILDAIADDKELTDEPINHRLPLLDSVERLRSDCFRDLSLVHRQWTSACQRRLAKRIVLRNHSSIVGLLRSPLAGAHTEELVISLGEMWSRSNRFPADPMKYFRPGDLEDDLVNLLKRMVRLRSLTVKENGLRDGRVLPAIAEIKSLEVLKWCCAHGHPSCDFSRLAKTLRCLPKVRELDVSGWSFRTTSGLAEAPLRRQIEALKVSISPGDLQLDRIGWLLQSLSIQKYSSLSIDVTLIGALNMYDVFRLFPDAQEALHKLDSLHLTNKGGFVEFNLAQARALILTCKNIKKLHIQGQSAPIAEFIDVLPASVEELYFSWFDMWMSPWSLVEQWLPEFIRGRRAPALRRLVIYNYEVPSQFYTAPGGSDGKRAPESSCPETRAACDAANVELDLWSKPQDWPPAL